jgi:hypothetical protein
VNRRSFLALASGLLVVAPEPVRAYSFIGGWREHVDHRFILDAVGVEVVWPYGPVTLARAIEALRDEGLAGVLTRPENCKVEWLTSDWGGRVLMARVPGLREGPS